MKATLKRMNCERRCPLGLKTGMPMTPKSNAVAHSRGDGEQISFGRVEETRSRVFRRGQETRAERAVRRPGPFEIDRTLDLERTVSRSVTWTVFLCCGEPVTLRASIREPASEFPPIGCSRPRCEQPHRRLAPTRSSSAKSACRCESTATPVDWSPQPHPARPYRSLSFGVTRDSIWRTGSWV